MIIKSVFIYLIAMYDLILCTLLQSRGYCRIWRDRHIFELRVEKPPRLRGRHLANIYLLSVSSLTRQGHRHTRSRADPSAGVVISSPAMTTYGPQPCSSPAQLTAVTDVDLGSSTVALFSSLLGTAGALRERSDIQRKDLLRRGGSTVGGGSLM